MAAAAVATPEQVMTCAIEGRLSKHALAGLLTLEARRAFADACGRVEQRYTNECRDLNDPCLESGCSAEGEPCLQPILRACIDYGKRAAPNGRRRARPAQENVARRLTGTLVRCNTVTSIDRRRSVDDDS